MSDERPPEYKVYRSRRRLLDRIRSSDDPGDRIRLPRPKERPPTPGEGRRRITPGRVLRYLALAAVGWLAVSGVLFIVSAQLEQAGSDRLEDALSGGGSLLTGSTILVLGSDERSDETREPGAAGGRADSIMLLHASFGRVRRLSILRDSFAEIPGHGAQKINHAYALGGAALTIETVEGFLGNDLEVNHVIEVSFEDFPEFIDTLGGIDVTLKRCISSQPFGGRSFRLRKGEHRLNGRRALAFARVRKNRCSPNESDEARARRQQQVLAAIRSRMLSPSTFLRLPWVSWQAPKTIHTDMAGPSLVGLFTDVMTGGAGKTRVLRPSGNGPAGSLTVSDEQKRRAVRQLVGG